MERPLERLVGCSCRPRGRLSLPHVLALHTYVINLLLHIGGQPRGSSLLWHLAASLTSVRQGPGVDIKYPSSP